MDDNLKQKLIAYYKEFYFYLYKKALLFFGNNETAKDIVQEVFYKITLELEKGNSKVFDRGYLLRTTTNLCIDHFRIKKARKEDQIEDIDNLEKSSEDLEIRRFLKQILEKLPSSFKEIAIYYYIDGFTLDETVELTKIPKRTLQRKIEKIKRILATFF